jgi:hypothetical protein
VKKASKALGKKFSKGRTRRHREAIAAAIAGGRKFGSPRHPLTHVETRICQLPTCGIEFPFLVRPKTDPNAGRYCCQKHAVQHVAILRMKVPDDYDLLFDLYVTKRMSTPEIGAMFDTTHGAVRHRLKYLGILTRKVGHSRHVVCNMKGCSDPVFKIKHPQNGSMYGTKCEKHYWEHRHWLARQSTLRKQQKRGNIPDAVCRVLATGVNSSEEIAKLLGVTTKVVSTTIGHLRRNGRVEPCGTIRSTKDRMTRLLWRLAEERTEMAA